jgi:hypothetical protein
MSLWSYVNGEIHDSAESVTHLNLHNENDIECSCLVFFLAVSCGDQSKLQKMDMRADLSLYNVDPQLQDVETFSTLEFYCKL